MPPLNLLISVFGRPVKPVALGPGSYRDSDGNRQKRRSWRNKERP